MDIPNLSPEESALALYNGLVERYQDAHVTLKEALPAIAALILVERFNAAVAQRERDAQIADNYFETKRVFDDDGSKNYHAGFIDGALTIREAIRAQ